MKAIIIFLITLGLGFECFGQVTKEVIFGTVLYDGYHSITKEAFWAQRPEAREIYYGGSPEGTETIVLQSPHFGMFAKGEHNKLDCNYIVFPIGAIIYKKNDQYFSAECGNRLVFFKPVDSVIIKEPTQFYNSKQMELENFMGNHNVIDYGGAKPKLGNLNPDTPAKEKKEIKIGFVVIPIGAMVLGGIAYLFVSSSYSGGGPGGTPITPDTGGPGGAPITSDTGGSGGTSITSDTGGPGGAPVTH